MLGLAVLSWCDHAEGVAWLAREALPIDFATAGLLTAVLLIWAAEWAYPSNAAWGYSLSQGGRRAMLGWAELLRDLFYLLIVAQVSALLLRLLAAAVEPRLRSAGFGFGLVHGLWPSGMPFAVGVAVAFFVTELFSYWMHRAAHRVPLLWRFHGTHHVISGLTTLKAVRTHPLDNAFFYFARNIPLLLLGVGVEQVVAVVYFGALLSLLAHANVAVAEGPLGLVVNYPRYHEVHHSADFAEANSNFGCHSILWDRVFGTFRGAVARPLVLGVEPVGPRTIGHELVGVFWRQP